MRIELFRMERTQCLYEHEVEYNLSESGVLPVRIEELVNDSAERERFLSLPLKYAESDGSPLLRERIAAWYPDANADSVLVTNGGSEANFTTVWGLVEKTDRVACMLPNYLQTWGLSRAYAAQADAFWLRERRQNGKMRWALDVESLNGAVTKKTKLIVVTNPNNPTGGVLTEEEMQEVIRCARRANAWLLADEIYRGAEVGGSMTPSFWGRYDKLLITSGLSKAFGMPGLRIGWIVGPPKMIAKLCWYRDYTTLTPTIASDRLAGIAMEPSRRESLLARTREIIRKHLPRLEDWIHTHDDIFTYIPPVAGAIAYVRYKLPIKSAALMQKLIDDRSVLITPGDHFGMGPYIRFGYGYDIEYTLRGLARVDQTLQELSKPARGRAMQVAAKRSGAA